MRRFLLYTTLMVLANGLLLLAVDAYRYYSGSYEQTAVGAEVYEAIHASRQRSAARRLLLGDSVCRQMYGVGQCSDSLTSLACNQAVTMAGHYILLRQYLDTHADSLPEEIILSFDAGSLRNDLDQYSYQYFLKPFFHRSAERYFSDDLRERLSGIPYYWSCRLPFIRTNGYTLTYSLPDRAFSLISPLSMAYLDSIMTTADAYGIPVRMLSNPIRESRRDWVDGRYAEAVSSGELAPHSLLFEQWHASITTCPDSCFRDDVHFHYGQIPVDLYHIQ